MIRIPHQIMFGTST